MYLESSSRGTNQGAHGTAYLERAVWQTSDHVSVYCQRQPDAVHFCIGGRRSTTDLLDLVRSLTEQLAERLADLW